MSKLYTRLSDSIHVTVKPVVYGQYGVFADATLIAIHNDLAGAQEHRERLIQQKSQDHSRHPLRRHSDRSDAIL
jgi:hypothetical protein